ncbi:MAG: FIST C-terminal domain-containing protein [Myxococcales bacterium]|nr:FIST C-terminal domain-containing protein [Myxococcales bacterium]
MTGLTISSKTSAATDSAAAIRDTYAALERDLGGAPSLLIAYVTVGHDLEAIAAGLREVAGDVPCHGATSCLGVMSDEGFAGADGVGLGLLGIRDPDGSYGVGARELGDDPRTAGREALLAAIAAAERQGEPPELVWIAANPGSEEAVIAGLQDVLGASVPIAGGSAADNDVSGKWHQLAGGEVLSGSVVVSVLYPSTKVRLAFHSGYSATDRSGVVTRAEGRTLYEIDGRPAALVYNEWTGGAIAEHLGGGNVLGATTLFPLGRVAGEHWGMPYHRLSHPDTVTKDGALTLFTEVEVGERLIQMAGTKESLITRAGRVARAAMAAGNLDANSLAGALVVYCAGCMLTVQDQIDAVADEFTRELMGRPFLGTFTFGEQGCFANHESYHGNLMISVAVFERE